MVFCCNYIMMTISEYNLIEKSFLKWKKIYLRNIMWKMIIDRFYKATNEKPPFTIVEWFRDI